VDLILDAGPTELGEESTVLDLTQSPPVILRPGGVTQEQLGGLRIAGSVADEVAAKGLAGPGMTVRHYAPQARVELFEDEAALRMRAGELRGRRVGVLTPTAENLYAEMRRLETEGIEVILCLLPPPTGIGLAIRDRLRRAAGCALAENRQSG
jgi:L-threonylcarbamoyladenylate synthase